MLTDGVMVCNGPTIKPGFQVYDALLLGKGVNRCISRVAVQPVLAFLPVTA